MSVGSNLQATATSLISSLGTTSAVTFTRDAPTNYSTSTLSYTNTSASTYTSKVVPIETLSSHLTSIGVTPILKGQKMLWVPGAVSQVPKVGDTTSINGVVYTVLEITTFEANSVTCVYLLRIGS